MAKETWKVTFWKATQDTSTASYTEINAASVSAFTGATSTTAYIVAPQKSKSFTVTETEDVGGWVESVTTLRDKFDLELYPYSYNDISDNPDLTDWETLASWLNDADYLWMSIAAGSRTYPSTSTKVHPIAIESVGESTNKSGGTHGVILTVKVKGLL